MKPPALSPQLTIGQRIWRGGLSGCMLSGLLLLRVFNPAEGGFSLSTPITQRLFGLPCPFCGITRGTHALLNGEVWRALYLNMATGLVLLVAIALILVWGVEAWRGREWNWFTQRVAAVFRRWKLLAAGLILFWLVHLGIALGLPKPELLDANAPLFPDFLFQNNKPR